jgi:DNA-binding transcriptional LysR family regulator
MAVLQNIQVFVRVIELGSFSAAARNLRLSPAVVSHRIRQLEGHVGVRLLNRTTRQVRPTEQGMLYYEACLEVLRAVEQAETSVAGAGAAPQGTLKVTAPLGFGRRILAPLIPAFQDQNPNVDVQVRMSDHLLDLLKEGVDAAVRMAAPADSSLVIRKIADCERVLCAAPCYLEANSEPATPDDLLEHNCLLLRFPGSQQFRWTLNGPKGPMTLNVHGNLDADDGDVLTRWAVDGRGIVMKPVWEVGDELRNGRLRPVLPDFPPDPVTLAILYPHRRLLPAKVRAFADFLIERVPPTLAQLTGGASLDKADQAGNTVPASPQVSSARLRRTSP